MTVTAGCLAAVIIILICHMNKYELFVMIFYALEHEWDQVGGDELGDFLSDMNPFMFDDVGAADPAVYSHFCSVIDERVTKENSYRLAWKYVDSVGKSFVKDAFLRISKSRWDECLNVYLLSEHKGMLKRGMV